ncbi:type II toxin-antitoxin system RelE/ParE family toxin [uncultured Methylobacterium sp.]|uniref:type II toxin-antitoxin system RelE/ParE family toxin n=1 Tax=uncultured Methylobacterium sp. TaxID=157278 RepID=UPI0035CA04DC
MEADDVHRIGREIRIREASGAFRVIYLAMIAEAVFVLHCFRKTTQKTSRDDLALAKRRYGDAIRGDSS